MQGTIAIVNFVCFYLIGVPVGALLGYFTNLQVKVDTRQHLTQASFRMFLVASVIPTWLFDREYGSE